MESRKKPLQRTEANNKSAWGLRTQKERAKIKNLENGGCGDIPSRRCLELSLCKRRP
jgi:hypothetical protein